MWSENRPEHGIAEPQSNNHVEDQFPCWKTLPVEFRRWIFCKIVRQYRNALTAIRRYTGLAKSPIRRVAPSLMNASF
jgi:hypothetical protein